MRARLHTPRSTHLRQRLPPRFGALAAQRTTDSYGKVAKNCSAPWSATSLALTPSAASATKARPRVRTSYDEPRCLRQDKLDPRRILPLHVTCTS